MPEQHGRYSKTNRATIPGELPEETRRGRGSPRREIRHAEVPDPNPALKGRRQRVAINIRVDALEHELARGRISEAVHLAGRVFRRVLEKSRTPPGSLSQWMKGDRVDQVIAHELKILRGIANAQASDVMLQEVRPIIGRVGEHLLIKVLIDGLSLTQVAGLMGNSSKHGVFYCSETFRRSLEALA
jgi:hypothetical protein